MYVSCLHTAPNTFSTLFNTDSASSAPLDARLVATTRRDECGTRRPHLARRCKDPGDESRRGKVRYYTTFVLKISIIVPHARALPAHCRSHPRLLLFGGPEPGILRPIPFPRSIAAACAFTVICSRPLCRLGCNTTSKKCTTSDQGRKSPSSLSAWPAPLRRREHTRQFSSTRASFDFKMLG